MELENVVYVYDKNMNLIAQFDDNIEGYDEKDMQNMMVAPKVSIETNGLSTLSFQMLANCEKWQTIKDPENIYYLNGRYYTAINENSYNYVGEGSIRIVNVTLAETWYLLGKKYTQAYNCGLYTYAKCKFRTFMIDCIWVNVRKNYCSVPSNAVSNALAFEQVKNWSTKDANGNFMPLNVIQSKEFAPVNWENPPSSIVLQSKMMMGEDLVLVLGTKNKKETQENYDYVPDKTHSYLIAGRPWPEKIKSVKINVTTAKEESQYNPATNSYSSVTVYTTEDIEVYADSDTKASTYYPSYGYFTISKTPESNQTFNFVTLVYDKSDFGEIEYDKDGGSWLTLGFGAEVVDEHTVCILPKADEKYKLTVNGVQYEDSDVKDSRGVIMPRGSGGYAMWAVLKNSGWSLGICDVIAKGFNAAEDYGCFNIESDMKDVLSNVKYIQELYGGILDWDSKNQILNYRAENDEDYQAYQDGFNDWTGYEFRQEKNMKDQPEVIVDNNIITKAFILGYGNLNIKSVNDGKSYLEDYSYTDAVYEGYLEQPLIYDTNDETGQKQLKYWGEKELHKMCRPRKSVTISANDIRTVQGCEHEIFNLNDVVRVYFKDDEGDLETFELKRIVKWEYNAFALWDSTIELGDKTSNFVEVFKLIYNKAVEEAPQTNASGKISASEIILDVDLSEFGFDTGGLGSGGYGISGSGYGYGTTLSEYIELIVQKITENSDAVSGLTIDADKLYAQTELFSTYQKQSDKMLSDAYAGITLYTDAQLSSLKATVQSNYTSLSNSINRVERNMEAGFEAQANQNAAFTRQFSEVDERITDVDNKQTNALAEFKTFASTEYAKASVFAQFTQETEEKFTQTTASITALADETKAELELKATHKEVTDSISTSEASIKEYASKNYAAISLETTVSNLSSSVNNRFTAVNYDISSLDSSVSSMKQKTAKIEIGTDKISLNYKEGVGTTGSSSIALSSNRMDFYASGTAVFHTNVSLNDGTMNITTGTYFTISSGATFSVFGSSVSWQSTSVVTDVDVETGKVTKETILYLG